MYKKILLLVLVLILISGCPTPEEQLQKQLDAVVNEPIEYSEFSQDGFSAKYPIWPAPEGPQGDVEVSITKGYCTVSINSEKIPAEHWTKMMKESVEKQGGEILQSKETILKHSLVYQNITLISENRIYDCNEKSIAITVTCIEFINDKIQKLHNEVFNSASCNKKEVEFKEFKDEDFVVEYPEWDELDQEEEEEQRILSKTKGVCSVIVDKHNALPKDLEGWIKQGIETKNDHNLLDASDNGKVYTINYELPYQDQTITAETKIFYCNYQSYLTQVLCVNEYMNEDFEKIRNEILSSSKCLQEYEIPTPEVIEEKKEEIIEKEPEVIEEIEDEIVKTNIGEEFGIEEEVIVYFINSNEFFKKIIKDFPLGNIVIEDTENNRNLNLKIIIDSESGKILLVEDGEHTNPDVTLFVPLREALNILSNANNINPLTLLGFAAKVRTEPVNVKNDVIQKFLRGEYN